MQEKRNFVYHLFNVPLFKVAIGIKKLQNEPSFHGAPS
jgi:hypothetical protein